MLASRLSRFYIFVFSFFRHSPQFRPNCLNLVYLAAFALERSFFHLFDFVSIYVYAVYYKFVLKNEFYLHYVKPRLDLERTILIAIATLCFCHRIETQN